MHNENSPFVKFAKAYCDRFGKFKDNPLTKQRSYAEADFWEAYFLMEEHENRNRKGK